MKRLIFLFLVVCGMNNALGMQLAENKNDRTDFVYYAIQHVAWKMGERLVQAYNDLKYSDDDNAQSWWHYLKERYDDFVEAGGLQFFNDK